MNMHKSGKEIGQIIRARRTVKPEKMNGRVIEDIVIDEMLENANWAPTHAKTEPWRFIVYGNAKVKEFARRHADLYKLHTEEGFTPQKYEKLERLGNNVSHIIVAWMKRVANHKIPEIEEVAATAAAVQNLLLTAAAHGIAAFWSTGGLTHHPAMRRQLGLDEEDRIIGILYLGYSDEPQQEGSRLIPLSEKTEWIK